MPLFPGSRNHDHEVKLPGPQGPDEYFPVMTVTIPHLRQDSLVSAPQNHVTSTRPLSWPRAHTGQTLRAGSDIKIRRPHPGSGLEQPTPTERENLHPQPHTHCVITARAAHLSPGIWRGNSSSPTPQPPGAGATAASREAHSPVVRFRQPAASLGRCSTRTKKEEGRDAWPPPPPPPVPHPSCRQAALTTVIPTEPARCG